jgi:hypothetical protein
MVYINDIEGFWSFAKEQLMKYYGVNPLKIPVSLAKMQVVAAGFWRIRPRLQ